MADDKKSSGVEQLIERLREQGVAEGQSRGEQAFEEARRRAEDRLEKARLEAEQIVQKAREEAEHTKAAGAEAVRLAVRDAILELKSELVDNFAAQVRRLVTHTLKNEDVFKLLILEVAGRAKPDESKPAQVLLPKDVVGLEQLRRDPGEVKEGSLSHLVLSLTGDMLRDGVELGNRRDGSPGIRIHLTEDDVEIDLTDNTIADLLLQHLLPRFRAMLEGIVQ